MATNDIKKTAHISGIIKAFYEYDKCYLLLGKLFLEKGAQNLSSLSTEN